MPITASSKILLPLAHNLDMEADTIGASKEAKVTLSLPRTN